MNVPSEARIRQAVHLNALVAIESGIFLYVLADWIMRKMIPGTSGPQEILGLQIAAVIYALYSLNAPGFYVLYAVGGARTNAGVVLFSGVVSLSLILLGARYLGLLGALAGNAGYLLTLLLIVYGLKRVGIALRHYLAWISFPLLGLVAALIVGIAFQSLLWLRVAFVVAEAALAVSWFLRGRQELGSTKLEIGQVSEG
jgi:O-antigen/teichoic acid export membrane protein